MKRSQEIERAILQTLSLVPDRYWPEDALYNDTRRRLLDEPTRTEAKEALERLEAKAQVKFDKKEDFRNVKVTREGLDRIEN